MLSSYTPVQTFLFLGVSFTGFGTAEGHEWESCWFEEDYWYSCVHALGSTYSGNKDPRLYPPGEGPLGPGFDNDWVCVKTINAVTKVCELVPHGHETLKERNQRILKYMVEAIVSGINLEKAACEQSVAEAGGSVSWQECLMTENPKTGYAYNELLEARSGPNKGIRSVKLWVDNDDGTQRRIYGAYNKETEEILIDVSWSEESPQAKDKDRELLITIVHELIHKDDWESDHEPGVFNYLEGYSTESAAEDAVCARAIEILKEIEVDEDADWDFRVKD